MVFRDPCLGIPGFEVHDSHLAGFRLELNSYVHAELPRRRNGHILYDDVGEFISPPWHPVSGIEDSDKVPGVPREGEETAGAAGVQLRIAHWLPCAVLIYNVAGLRGQNVVYRRRG